MRNEVEVLFKYKEMVENLNKVHNIVQNPPIDMLFDEIQKNIDGEFEQYSYNCLMEWVLGLDKPLTVEEINKRITELKSLNR